MVDRRVLVPCSISPGAFSGECVVTIADSDPEYVGIAPVGHVRESRAPQEFPDFVEGYLIQRMGELARVELPDGNVIVAKNVGLLAQEIEDKRETQMAETYSISGAFPIRGYLTVCCRCGRKIVVELLANGSNHAVDVLATCGDCVKPDQAFWDAYPGVARQIERWKNA
ncbi:MAG TPA: hypothetical protein VFT74_14155 [Isosphaeraceae bacterium]|nr:hypothetical protein [Isosphaeraceae bacterium]